jgi:hypothetical protein
MKRLNLHGHDVLIRRHQLITHLDPHLQGNRGFLQIGHHIIQRHARLTEGELFRLRTRSGLGIADTVKSGMQLPRKADARLFSATF